MHLLGMLPSHACGVPSLLHPRNVFVLEENAVRLLSLAVLPLYLFLGEGHHLHLPQGFLAHVLEGMMKLHRFCSFREARLLLRLYLLRLVPLLADLSIQNTSLNVFVGSSSREIFASFLRKRGGSLHRPRVELSKRYQTLFGLKRCILKD